MRRGPRTTPIREGGSGIYEPRRGGKPGAAAPAAPAASAAAFGGQIDCKLMGLLVLLALSLGLFYHMATSDGDNSSSWPLVLRSPLSTDNNNNNIDALSKSVPESLAGYDPVEYVRQVGGGVVASATTTTTTSSPTSALPTTTTTTEPLPATLQEPVVDTTKQDVDDDDDDNAYGDDNKISSDEDDATPSSSSNEPPPTTTTTTPPPTLPGRAQTPLPDYTAEELTKRGFGKVLYVYRVVADNVAVRTKPSPIGSLQSGASADAMGPIHGGGYKRGDLVVGLQLANVFGQWLKLGPYYWAPVTKKKGEMFIPVMKQIKMLSLPKYLRHFWQKPACGADEEASISAECRDANMVRSGVLLVMRRMKLMDASMDPDLQVKDKDDEEDDEEEEEEKPVVAAAQDEEQEEAETAEGDNAVEPAQEEAVEPAAANGEEDDDEEEEGEEDDGDAPAAAAVSSSSGTDAMHAHCQTLSTKDACSSSSSHCTWSRKGGGRAQCVLQCRDTRNWFFCTKRAECAWVHLPNSEFCDLDLDAVSTGNKPTPPPELAHNAQFDFVAPPPPSITTAAASAPREKFFIYQSSGGWNNQRLLLENALVVCMLLNRTCIAPPAAPHSNFFRNYNNMPSTGTVPMSAVLNFDELNKVVPVRAIPPGQTFPAFLSDEIFAKLSVRTVTKDISKYKPGTMNKWAERDIVRLFGNVSNDVLYFSNQTMWGTMEWRGTIAGRYEKKRVQLHMMPSNHLKQVALKLAMGMGRPFHAVHIRRGDKVGESNFQQVSHAPQWWAERIAQHRAESSLVYVATDEAQRTYFDTFARDYQLEPVFFETLPGYEQVLKPYLAHYPARMSMDVLGMIEQLVCAYANKFLGSGYSTFTTYILRLRKHRAVLATDTSFAVREDSLPVAVRHEKSKCSPLGALTHNTPC